MLPTLHSLKGSCTQVKQLAQMPFEPLFPTSCFHCNISFRNRFRSCVPHHRNLHVKSGQMAMPCSNQIPFQSETFTKRLWNWFDLTFISIAYIGPRSVLEMNIYCDEHFGILYLGIRYTVISRHHPDSKSAGICTAKFARLHFLHVALSLLLLLHELQEQSLHTI